jgi:hypothetical protein
MLEKEIRSMVILGCNSGLNLLGMLLGNKDFSEKIPTKKLAVSDDFYFSRRVEMFTIKVAIPVPELHLRS